MHESVDDDAVERTMPATLAAGVLVTRGQNPEEALNPTYRFINLEFSGYSQVWKCFSSNCC